MTRCYIRSCLDSYYSSIGPCRRVRGCKSTVASSMLQSRVERFEKAMLRTVTVLLVLSALSLHADAFSNIVAFGDSLTDDCTMGISQVIEEALGTNQVRIFPLPNLIVSSNPQNAAIENPTLCISYVNSVFAALPGNAVLQGLCLQQWASVCSSSSRDPGCAADKLCQRWSQLWSGTCLYSVACRLCKQLHASQH